MKNEHWIVGDVAVLIVKAKGGKRLACLIDAEDLPRIETRTSWRARWIESCQTHYAYTAIKGKQVQLHRLIMYAPKHKEVDHVFHDGLDNRKSRLALASRRQNGRNRRGASTRSSTGERNIFPSQSGTFRVVWAEVDGKRLESTAKTLERAIEIRNQNELRVLGRRRDTVSLLRYRALQVGEIKDV